MHFPLKQSPRETKSNLFLLEAVFYSHTTNVNPLDVFVIVINWYCYHACTTNGQALLLFLLKIVKASFYKTVKNSQRLFFVVSRSFTSIDDQLILVF